MLQKLSLALLLLACVTVLGVLAKLSWLLYSPPSKTVPALAYEDKHIAATIDAPKQDEPETKAHSQDQVPPKETKTGVDEDSFQAKSVPFPPRLKPVALISEVAKIDLIQQEFGELKSKIINHLHQQKGSSADSVTLADLGVEMERYGGYSLDSETLVTAVNGFSIEQLLNELPAGSVLAGQELNITVSHGGGKQQLVFEPY